MIALLLFFDIRHPLLRLTRSLGRGEDGQLGTADLENVADTEENKVVETDAIFIVDEV